MHLLDPLVNRPTFSPASGICKGLLSVTTPINLLFKYIEKSILDIPELFLEICASKDKSYTGISWEVDLSDPTNFPSSTRILARDPQSFLGTAIFVFPDSCVVYGVFSTL